VRGSNERGIPAGSRVELSKGKGKTSTVEEKLALFLSKKANKIRPLQNNAISLKIAADNAKQSVLEAIPDLPLTGEHGDRYLRGIDAKFLCLDKKILPEYMSDGLKASIAQQRQKAFEKAESYTDRYVRRKAQSIQGSNLKIPEWMILREDEPTLDHEYSVEKVSFPKQYYSAGGKTPPIRKLAEAYKNATTSFDGCEPALAGFRNEGTSVAYFPIDKSGKTIKGFFRNYLEVCRLNPRAPFYAWCEAMSRDPRPIFTLTNRAKPLRPVIYVGKANRPFPVEVGGVTYFCEGDDAEAMFLMLPEGERRLFVQCCIVKAARPKLSVNYIVDRMLEIGPMEEIPIESAPPLELENMQPRFHKAREVLLELSDSDLEKLVEAKWLSQRHYDLLRDSRIFWRSLPRRSRIISMSGSEERAKLLEAEMQEQQAIRDEIYSIVGEPGKIEKLVLVSESSIFDLSDEDDSPGFFDFMEESAIPEEEESSAGNDRPEVDMDFMGEHALNLAEASDEDLKLASIEFDPRFISEVRLWPTSRSYWKPP
jgi:hypothetical protein